MAVAKKDQGLEVFKTINELNKDLQAEQMRLLIKF